MDSSYKLIVKFKPEEIARVKDGELFFANPQKIMATASVILNFNYTLVIQDLAETGDIVCTENSFDFSQYKGLVYVKDTELRSKEEIERMAVMFNGLDIVEYAEVVSATPPPPPGACHTTENGEISISVASNTPDFSNRQLYLGGQHPSNPSIWGIDADFGLEVQADGRGIRCANIEWGFIFDHEDLASPNFIEIYPTTDHSHDDHGAAVMGILYARHNGFGMRGATPNLDVLYGISERPFGRVNAIAAAVRRMRAGDVIIYEMQSIGQNGNEVPPDFERAVWDITQRATHAGIIVISAAGNGNENLDGPFYNEYRSRGDNGIILVGAGTRNGRNRTDFSTYGTPVHVQGWGDFSVASTGYGDLFNQGRRRTYTNEFAGTSSATPLVASVAIAAQSWYRRTNNGQTLTPRQMRDLLIRTGIAQGMGRAGHIGPLPNTRNALMALQTGTFDGGGKFFEINTSAQLTQLANDDDGSFLSQLLQAQSGVEIATQDGCWAGRIVFPPASTVPAGQVIRINHQATWDSVFVINGQDRSFQKGQTLQFSAGHKEWLPIVS